MRDDACITGGPLWRSQPVPPPPPVGTYGPPIMTVLGPAYPQNLPDALDGFPPTTSGLGCREAFGNVQQVRDYYGFIVYG